MFKKMLILASLNFGIYVKNFSADSYIIPEAERVSRFQGAYTQLMTAAETHEHERIGVIVLASSLPCTHLDRPITFSSESFELALKKARESALSRTEEDRQKTIDVLTRLKRSRQEQEWEWKRKYCPSFRFP